MQTLCEKVGGQDAIGAVVDKFYDYMLEDPVVRDYFKNTDMEKQRKQQKAFITMATGGPNHYEGKDMKEAHAKFPIGQTEFDATWNNLQKALQYYAVKEEIIA